MKKLLLLVFLLLSFSNLFCQERNKKPFVTTSINMTFGENEYDTGFGDGEALIAISALLLRAGVGYKFNRRISTNFNFGYDTHKNPNIDTFLMYSSFIYNIIEQDDNALFTEISYGKLWSPSNRFPKGKYYGIGVGWEIDFFKNTSSTIKIKYHKKQMLHTIKPLNSLSIGFGFNFY